jgi:glycosyltransferase involved in cell wall biosynthesis
VRIHVVDPPAYTPPYDRALCAALARSGLDVELVTSAFAYGPVPPAEGYRVREAFYARSAAAGGLDPRARRAMRLAEHVPDMLRYRRSARAAEVVHFQWLTVPPLDLLLLPDRRPRVLTAHDVLPREPRPGQTAAVRRLLRRMDAVVVHSEHGAQRLREEAGVPSELVHVIPHGAFDYLTRLPCEVALPPELSAVQAPVVLFFGLLRPYKGLDVLLDAMAEMRGAELWVVGMPRLPIEALRRRAEALEATVRWVPRFVGDPEIPAYFRRADVVVLPYREIDQSGVLYTALAFGKPLVLTRVGGFTEVAERDGAARLVPPGDPAALAEALDQLVHDPPQRERLAAAARAAARGPYAWDSVAARTRALYEELLD